MNTLKTDLALLENNFSTKTKKLLNSLFAEKKYSDEIFIYGAGNYGKIILELLRKNGINPSGFIDNFSEQDEIDGLKIFRHEQIQNKNSLIIVATLYNAFEIIQKLKADGFSNVLFFLTLLIKKNANLDTKTFFDQTLEEYALDIIINETEYKKTRDLFEDDLSKKFLDYIYNERKKLDFVDTPEKFYTEQHYFPGEIFSMTENEIFLDGGGFIGDTTFEFMEKVDYKYDKIIIFEPLPQNIEQIQKNLTGYNNITIIPKGINDKDVKLFFDTYNDEQKGRFSQDGREFIETVKIDSVIKDRVTFIKFDIEGYEKKGLLGAVETIKKYSPKLAICSYHRPQDLWEIPQVIKSINPDYKIYLRLLPACLETIVFAVPS